MDDPHCDLRLVPDDTAMRDLRTSSNPLIRALDTLAAWWLTRDEPR